MEDRRQINYIELFNELIRAICPVAIVEGGDSDNRDIEECSWCTIDESKRNIILGFNRDDLERGYTWKIKLPARLADHQYTETLAYANEVISEVYGIYARTSGYLINPLPLSKDGISKNIIANYLKPNINYNYIDIFTEIATHYTYEMNRVAPIIIFPHNIDLFNRLVDENIAAKVRHRIDFVNGLREERWMHAVMDGKRTAIAVNSKDGNILGLIALERLPQIGKEGLAAPHVSMLNVQNYLSNLGDIALFAAGNGDLYILRGKNIVIKRARGHWYFHDYRIVHTLLQNRGLRGVVAKEILRMVLDLSFERRGALFWVLGRNKDFGEGGGVNHKLRMAMKGMYISNWGTRELICSGAMVDGAVVISAEGEILDVGHSIPDGDESSFNKSMLSEYSQLSGHRSKAAFRASAINGFAIKVSEDGPIEFYFRGLKVRID